MPGCYHGFPPLSTKMLQEILREDDVALIQSIINAGIKVNEEIGKIIATDRFINGCSNTWTMLYCPNPDVGAPIYKPGGSPIQYPDIPDSP
jgi:hypothetical protein